jgi:hypothetical protein
MTYIAQLQELYDAYPGKELEAALGVTVRSMQNYLKQENPTIPGKEVINRIREVYANYKQGRPLVEAKESEPPKTAERDIIFNLTESNRMMAEAMLTDARNRESLTRSNERLTLKVTADDPQQTSLELIAIRQAVVEFVIEVASGKRYKDRFEAGQAYSKKVAELIEAAKGKGIQKNSDRMHTVK